MGSRLVLCHVARRQPAGGAKTFHRFDEGPNLLQSDTLGKRGQGLWVGGALSIAWSGGNREPKEKPSNDRNCPHRTPRRSPLAARPPSQHARSSSYRGRAK